ncbi:MAG: DJ-1/PfpI family protein [Kiritimatiellae bacterium]|nr:DJ-1/PfpI family protein [Kiritimatiellia bacterium]
MTNVVVPLADGAEEMEAVIAVDVMRRAEWDVVIAGLRDGVVIAARGTQLLPDCLLEDIDRDLFDMIVIPGGTGGVERLCGSELLREWVVDFSEQGKRLAAICAGPKVLYDAGVLAGRRCTCYPGLERDMPAANWEDEPFVADDVFFTARAAGTSFLFALRLIELVDGYEKAARIAKSMCFDFTPYDGPIPVHLARK